MSPTPPAPTETPHLISVDPDPPKRGQQVTICYAFREGDPSPAPLQVDFDVPGGVNSQSIEVSKAEPCETITVPADAIGILITDLYGPSADFGTVI